MFCSEFCYAFSIASTKFALLTLYWRLFKMSSIRIPIQIMFTISVTWIILRTFMVAFQCLPTQYFWNKSIHGHCAINESHFFFGTILTHCVMDVVILALPVIEVAKLHLPLRERLAVIGLFFIGFL
ncbi:fungal fucose-specific lectin [Purpureocillium lavendulum]|uniref:Fungal fucose-specific lectin n=1 Tax=Purpureocillium lavendulum TaxID=1247861 RepID=A0AB34FF88_9HYPO|nr:Ubiquitin carboxyl-terminal hydrolase 21 [Purpureocillium lavendulum]KAJ6437932.1 fungal fucose-specific lectin [Purpureocillium lavendulum]